MSKRSSWVVWLSWGVVACGHLAPSTAPLSAPGQGTPAQAAAGEPSAATTPAAASTSKKTEISAGGTAKPAAAKSGKQGKRALYQRSCDLGSPLACNELAIMLGEDWQHVLPLLQRACELGLTRGCANYGVQLLRSDPSEKTRDRAVELLGHACDASDEFACAELGDALYEHAQGKAHVAYEKGCKLGSLLSCLSDGWMLRNGDGAPKDDARARELFRLVCDRQGYNGCAALGYDLTDGAKNQDEFAEGTRLLKLACEHDEAFGCFSLGASMLAHGGQQALDGGLSLLKRSCTLGFENGCRYASTLEQRLKNGATASAPDSDDADAEEEDDDEESE